MDELKIYVYTYMFPSALILSCGVTFFILRVLPRLQVKEGRMEMGSPGPSIWSTGWRHPEVWG